MSNIFKYPIWLKKYLEIYPISNISNGHETCLWFCHHQRNMRQYDNIWQYKRQIWFSNTTKYDKYKKHVIIMTNMGKYLVYVSQTNRSRRVSKYWLRNIKYPNRTTILLAQSCYRLYLRNILAPTSWWWSF